MQLDFISMVPKKSTGTMIVQYSWFRGIRIVYVHDGLRAEYYKFENGHESTLNYFELTSLAPVENRDSKRSSGAKLVKNEAT